MIEEENNQNIIFYSLLTIIVCLLIYVANTLSISYKEALNVFENNSLLTYITNASLYIFGQNDIALRLPFIIFYTLSIILMYKLTQNYFKYKQDRLVTIILFMILPGVLSASILVNSSIIVIFFTLLYIYLFRFKKDYSYLLMIILLFIDNSFAILYLAMAFYSFNTNDRKTLIFSILFFIFSLVLYGFETVGKPKGYFLDTFAIYATVFSPFLFIYFIYAVYKVGLKGEKTLIWYISTTALLLSLVLSFRQKIYIEDFAPYVVISLPFMLKHFFHSYRVRLNQFRMKHKVIAGLVLFMLVLNATLTVINKPLYFFLSDPTKHFAYKYHIAKELSKTLKALEIKKINTFNEKLQLRLRFYGISKGNNYLLTDYKYKKDNYRVININYHGINIKKYYLYETQ